NRGCRRHRLRRRHVRVRGGLLVRGFVCLRRLLSVRGGRLMARIGVVTFPGSLDDRDAQRAIRLVGAEPVALWHGDHDLQGVDAIVLPGGFSYGDYLRCGALAAHSPIMSEAISAATAGLPVPR